VATGDARHDKGDELRSMGGNRGGTYGTGARTFRFKYMGSVKFGLFKGCVTSSQKHACGALTDPDGLRERMQVGSGVLHAIFGPSMESSAHPCHGRSGPLFPRMNVTKLRATAYFLGRASVPARTATVR
jgi:hypothetical protein